jgi:hypothetical protein
MTGSGRTRGCAPWFRRDLKNDIVLAGAMAFTRKLSATTSGLKARPTPIFTLPNGPAVCTHFFDRRLVLERTDYLFKPIRGRRMNQTMITELGDRRLDGCEAFFNRRVDRHASSPPRERRALDLA